MGVWRRYRVELTLARLGRTEDLDEAAEILRARLTDLADLAGALIDRLRARRGDGGADQLHDPVVVRWERLAWAALSIWFDGAGGVPRLPRGRRPVDALLVRLYPAMDTVVRTDDADLMAATISECPELLNLQVLTAHDEIADDLAHGKRAFVLAARIRRRTAGLRDGGRFHPDEFLPEEQAQARLRTIIERFVTLISGSGDVQVRDAALDHGDRMVAHPCWWDVPSEDRMHLLSDLANGWYARFEDRRVPADGERALALYRDLVAQTPPDVAVYPGLLGNFGNCLRLLGRSGEAVTVLRVAVSLAGPRFHRVHLLLNNLGNAALDVAGAEDDDTELKRAIAAFTLAARATGDPELPMFLTNLSRALFLRYQRVGRPADLAAAVVYARDAANRALLSHFVQGHLARVLAESGEIDAASSLVGDALRLAPPRQPERTIYTAIRTALADDGPDRPANEPSTMDDIRRTVTTATDATTPAPDRLAALDQVIRALDRGLDRAGSAADAITYLGFLAEAWNTRHLVSDDLADLDRAIDANTRLMRLDGAPLRLLRLGARLTDRYRKTGSEESIRAAVDVLRDAYAACPADDEDRWEFPEELGTALTDLYLHTGDPATLAEALRCAEEALALIPPDRPEHAGLLLDVAIARYELAEPGEDVSAYLRVARGDPAAEARFGLRLRSRYLRSGDPRDITHAIALLRAGVDHATHDVTAAALTADLCGAMRLNAGATSRSAVIEETEQLLRARLATTTHRDARLRLLFELGGTLYERYEATGDGEALDECVRMDEESLGLAGTAGAELIGGLATALTERYRFLGRRPDLDRAVALLREAVELKSAGTGPAVLRNSLGMALRLQSQADHRTDLLAAAATLMRQAVDALPLNAPYRATYIANLAGTTLELDTDDDNRTAAITSIWETLETAPNPTVRASLNLSLGRLLRPVDEQAAADALTAATTAADPTVRMRAYRDLGNLLLDRELWPAAAEALVRCIDSFDAIFARQRTRPSQESWLRECSGIPAAAAHALARTGDLDRAVDVLETGRTRLLNQALAATGRTTRPVRPRDHPLVHLMAARADGLAIITAPDGTRRALWLPGIGAKLAATSRDYTHALITHEQWPQTLDAVLARLGRDILAPLLDATGNPTALTVIPVGPLAILPLHAARIDGPDGRVHVLAPPPSDTRRTRRLHLRTG